MKSNTDTYGKLYVRNGNHQQGTTTASSPSTTIGSVTWLSEYGVTNYTFDSLYIIESGELAINPVGLPTSKRQAPEVSSLSLYVLLV